MTGETPDISEYLYFVFLDWCWYNNNSGLGETKLGKWMGVYHRVVSLMYYWMLTANGVVVSRMNVSKVTNIRSQTDENKSSIAALYQAIQECLNNDVRIIVEGSKGKPKFWIEHPFDWDPDFQEEFNHIGFNEEVAEAGNDFSPDFYDVIYLNMELSLHKRGKPEK